MFCWLAVSVCIVISGAWFRFGVLASFAWVCFGVSCIWLLVDCVLFVVDLLFYLILIVL